MHWQDLALTVASLIFIIALIPTALSKDQKPVLTTSILNAIVAIAIAVVYVTLRFWFAAGTTGVNGMLWMVIGVQTFALRRRTA